MLICFDLTYVRCFIKYKYLLCSQPQRRGSSRRKVGENEFYYSYDDCDVKGRGRDYRYQGEDRFDNSDKDVMSEEDGPVRFQRILGDGEYCVSCTFGSIRLLVSYKLRYVIRDCVIL